MMILEDLRKRKLQESQNAIQDLDNKIKILEFKFSSL